MKSKPFYTFFLAAAFFAGAQAHAQPADSVPPELEKHTWSFNAETIQKGYTISTPDGIFHIGVLPDVLKGETDVTVKAFDHGQDVDREIFRVGETHEAASSAKTDEKEQKTNRLELNWPLPEGKEIISPVYEFDIKGAADLYNPEKPLWLRMHYQADTLEDKRAYYFNKGKQQWIPIPTKDHEADNSVRAAIHLTYAPMAILADKIPAKGEASWYAYQDCNCAASRNYPYGTLLEVTDTRTEKSVIVEVNDYGPEEWTGRVIDLDVTAFEQLTEKWRGLTEVTVEPYILDEETFKKEGLPKIYGDQSTQKENSDNV